KKHKVQKVILMPLMMVAGDHANNDMAGDEDDSHKKILEAAGFQVETVLKGIGENKKIQQLYVERANDAWNALEAD
ncbi:MAG: sirohydrochlorin cobaltochelatase, partial [Selenomonadaceae bacterium]|nr:sirohydrochlorin cobaltochelatase [Selenomonadaceae bacterium]